MKELTKRAVRRSAAVVAAVVGISLAAGHISLEDLTNWSRTAALLSAGLLQPEGGAEALSARLEREPAAAGKGTQASATTTTGKTGTTAAGTGTTQAETPQDGPPALLPEVVPPQGPKGGKVSEQQLTLGSNFVQGIALKNSSGKTFDIAKELQILPEITIKNTPEPQVLLVHTHTTEAYMTYYAGYYNEGDGGRTRDESKNVCAVGEVIAAQLRAAGIGVIHDTTIHDDPKYTGAYTRSEETVKKNLEKYPSIQVVLDLHRDGIMIDSTTRAKPTVTIDGRKAAQMMIIASAASTETNPHPHWQDNFRFALQLQKAMVDKYEGLMRPVSVVASRYNQHLSRGYLLIEVGSEANTLNEAVYSGYMLGKTLAELLPKFRA